MGIQGGGFLLINKPSGITSHDVIDALRKITGIKTIGHSGTLDPLAEGLLVVAIGRPFTKFLSSFQKQDKEYIADVYLGAFSDTFDKDGNIVRKKYIKIPSQEEIKENFKKFVGVIEQQPPPFSAKKINGVKAYQLARKGILIALKSQRIQIYDIAVLAYHFPMLNIKVKCSTGTYIRSLVNDIGQTLNCGAYLEALKRIRIGFFSIDQAVSLSEITAYNWRNYLKKM
jgi:tRNA pseudouridine55 synthase